MKVYDGPLSPPHTPKKGEGGILILNSSDIWL